MITFRRVLRAPAGVAAGALLAVAPVAAVGAAGTPHITAHPDDLMVNSTTMLTGRGFPPTSTIAIEECGATDWVVTQKVCDTANAISVTTDASGRFKAPLTADLCPRVKVGHPVTREKCYVGEPKPDGIDTETLVGAAKLIVTYP